MMQAALVEAVGQGPVYGEFPEPVPSPGEVVVTVTASALSQVVRSRASGAHYSSSGAFPFVPGIDGAGRLDDGRRVYFAFPRAPHGALSERTAVRAGQCLQLPDDLDDVTAAAIVNPGISSWAAYVERARLQPGETVLVNGATGTAGRLAVQIARHLGAGKVIATGRDAAALDTLGADATIVLPADGDALEQAFATQFAQRVDVVIDYLWGRSAGVLLIAAAKTGEDAVPIRVVQIGAVSGQEITLPSAVLRSSAIELMGSGLGSVPVGRFLIDIGDLLQAVRPAGLRIDTRTMPLSSVEHAWRGDDADRRRLVFTTDALSG